MPRRVAIAIDSSDCSVQALSWCLKNFLAKDDEVTLVHVLDSRPIELPDRDKTKIGGFGYASLRDLNKEICQLHNKKAIALLRDFQRICLRKGFDTERKLLSGHVKHVLCEFARAEKIDVVAVGSRGLTAAGRAFLGSVSDFCVHNMPCPVMVVKCFDTCCSGTTKSDIVFSRVTS